MILSLIFPFDLTGPQFLLFYILFCGGLFALAGYLRWSLRLPLADRSVDVPADEYEITWLAGQEKMVLYGALAQLAADGNIAVYDQRGGSLRATMSPAKTAHPIEKFVYDRIAADGPATVRDLQIDVKEISEPLENSLREKGLVVDRLTRARAIFYPALVAVIPIIIGVIKIFVGISRDRPVEFLIILCFASFAAFCFLFLRTPVLSRRGDVVLKELRSRYEEQRGPLLSSKRSLSILVALFGVQILTSTSMADLLPIFRPPNGSDSGGSSCSSGGGGDGGGSGCGGCGGGGH